MYKILTLVNIKLLISEEYATTVFRELKEATGSSETLVCTYQTTKYILENFNLDFMCLHPLSYNTFNLDINLELSQ
jgi:hypothetical protein